MSLCFTCKKRPRFGTVSLFFDHQSLAQSTWHVLTQLVAKLKVRYGCRMTIILFWVSVLHRSIETLFRTFTLRFYRTEQTPSSATSRAHPNPQHSHHPALTCKAVYLSLIYPPTSGLATCTAKPYSTCHELPPSHPTCLTFKIFFLLSSSTFDVESGVPISCITFHPRKPSDLRVTLPHMYTADKTGHTTSTSLPH